VTSPGTSSAARRSLTAVGVEVAYDGVPVLAGVRLEAGGRGVVGLIGPNGSGKTTLLRVLYGALAPAAGTVELDGTALARLRPQERARRMAVVAQEQPPEVPISVADLVLLGRSPLVPPLRSYRREDHAAAERALRRVGLLHLADRPVTALSGGERQRVLIARALAQGGAHLLLDEPTNHLDIRYQHEVLGLLRELDVSVVVVLHDLNLAARFCDRLVLLHGGVVAAAGTVDEVLRPEVLEPVYEVRVSRVDHDGRVLLAFDLPG
jgi:iron complex transport system ATP-binding protein